MKELPCKTHRKGKIIFGLDHTLTENSEYYLNWYIVDKGNYHQVVEWYSKQGKTSTFSNLPIQNINFPPSAILF
jgi:hypothetical protein